MPQVSQNWGVTCKMNATTATAVVARSKRHRILLGCGAVSLWGESIFCQSVFIPHVDHLAGIFNHAAARSSSPEATSWDPEMQRRAKFTRVYLPAKSVEAVDRLRLGYEELWGFSINMTLIGVTPGEEFEAEPGLWVEVMGSGAAVGFVFYQEATRVKPAHAHLSGVEKAALGRAFQLKEWYMEPQLAYCTGEMAGDPKIRTAKVQVTDGGWRRN